MISGNHWAMVAAMFVAITVIVAILQYGIKNKHLVKRFSDSFYFLVSAASALTISVLLVVESHAGIIQLLDNALRGNESPILSGILLGPTAMLFGALFGFALIIISEVITSLRKRSLIKKLHRAKHHQRIRRGQPAGKPRPGATQPTRYNEARDTANHRKYYANRVNADKGMHRR